MKKAMTLIAFVILGCLMLGAGTGPDFLKGLYDVQLVTMKKTSKSFP